MPGKAPGRRTLALLLVALLAGAAPLAWAPEAEGQVPANYEITAPAPNVTVPMNARPGGYNIGYLDITVENTGSAALDISIIIWYASEDPPLSNRLSPGFTITTYPGDVRRIPIIIIDETGTYPVNATITVNGIGREPSVTVSIEKTTSFQVTLVPGDYSTKTPDFFEISYPRNVAISADGTSLAFAGAQLFYENFARLDFSYPLPKITWTYSEGHPEILTSTISADGRYLAAGTNTGRLYLFQDTIPIPIWTAGLGSRVSALQFSSDGMYLAAGTADGNLLFFARDNATARWTHAGNGSVEVLAITGDGAFVAAGSASGNVSLFGRESATPIWTHAAGSAVRTLAMANDGEYLVAGSADGNLSLFHHDNATPIWTRPLGGAVNEVAMSADGGWIVAAAAGGNLSLFRRDSATPEWKRGFGAAVASVSMSADGRYISAGAGDEVRMMTREEGVELWNWTSLNYTAPGYPQQVHRVQLSADGEWLAVEYHEIFLLFYTDTHPIAIIDSPLPNTLVASQGVTFSGHGTAYGPEREFIGYEWNSSVDGLLSTEATFVTSQLSPGHHLISLRVQDADGEWSLPLTIPLHVKPAPVENDTGIAAPPLPLLLAALALAAARRRFR